MKIKKLCISNFRKFENIEFELDDQMNVFAGKNGSGKTAVLEAANVILGAYLAAFKKLVPSRFVYNISKNDAHLKTLISDDSSILTTGGIHQFPCKISCVMDWEGNEELIQFQRILPKEEGRTKFDGSNPMQPTVVEWEKEISSADHSDDKVILPLVLYLSSARLWNEHNSKTTKDGVYSRTEAYTRCLDDKHGIELAFNYIQMLKSIALEENNGKNYPSYDALLKAVNYALKDELNPGESVIFSTRYERDIVALKTLDGTVVPFSSLSDGYRNVIKIILDIAVRMCILNPYLKDNALVKTPGVVIIDEIDLSLHPTWQKRIINILKTLFPEIQFICATHSPFIIQSLDEGELITLDKKIDSEYSGESIEDIAEDVMGVKLPQYSDKKIKMYEAAKKYYNALENCDSLSDIESLRQEMVKLEAEYSDNPAYLALIHQEQIVKTMEVEKNETNK